MWKWFDDEIAACIGLNEAIMLNSFDYWVQKNKDNEINFHDGHYWTYNTLEAFKKQFPFWSIRTIKRIIRSLKKNGYISTACYNKPSTDRTSWYTITGKAESLLRKTAKPVEKSPLCQNGTMDSANLTQCIGSDWPNALGQNDFPTNNKKYTNKIYTNKNARAKKLAPPFDDPSQELLEAWDGYVEMRKAKRNPLTERAAKLTANKLEKLAKGDDAKKAAILDQSVQRGWQGVFELQEDKQTRKDKSYGPSQSVEDMYEEAQEILRKGGGFL